MLFLETVHFDVYSLGDFEDDVHNLFNSAFSFSIFL